MLFLKHKYGNQKYIFKVCVCNVYTTFYGMKTIFWMILIIDASHHYTKRVVILQIHKFSFEVIKQLFDWEYCFQIPRC